MTMEFSAPAGYITSIVYVVLNTVISVTAALPAAYAFSRYHFFGDKHLFFWLLTNRMAPAAVCNTTVVPNSSRLWAKTGLPGCSVCMAR